MSSVLACSPTFSDSHDAFAKFACDFGAKLKIKDRDSVNGKEEEEEFSFACSNSSRPAASADELFHNGQIRPMFPLYVNEYDCSLPLRPPLKKLFVERREISLPLSENSELDECKGVPEGSYCRWSRNTSMDVDVVTEKCKKSNSTGFSKLWRLRDLKLRSHSDGNDAFVFLKPSKKKRSSSGADAKKTVKTVEKVSSGEGKNGVVKIVKAKKSRTASCAPEKHYVNRARRESNRRRSYLPYKQDLVGFFTNVNRFSKNIHPF